MGSADLDRKSDQYTSQNVRAEGRGGQEPTSDQERERDAHSLPGTNQAGKGPDAADQDDRPSGGRGEPGAC